MSEVNKSVQAASEVDTEELGAFFALLGSDISSSNALLSEFGSSISISSEELVQYEVKLTVTATDGAKFNGIYEDLFID
jgi:hypothetical protein